MPIQPIAGPAGGGKSQVVAEALRPGMVLIDFTAIWAALAGVERGPDGLYPVRRDDDPLVPLVSAVQAFALSQAVERQLDGFVTTASRDRVALLERITGQPARIVDPGIETVLERLELHTDRVIAGFDTGEIEQVSLIDRGRGREIVRASEAERSARRYRISKPCRRAAERWYGSSRGGGRRR